MVRHSKSFEDLLKRYGKLKVRDLVNKSPEQAQAIAELSSKFIAVEKARQKVLMEIADKFGFTDEDRRRMRIWLRGSV